MTSADVQRREKIARIIDPDAWMMRDRYQELIESGGPPVVIPTRRSFGTRMMRSLGQQLNGQVDLTYEPSGFVYRLDVPLGSIAAVI